MPIDTTGARSLRFPVVALLNDTSKEGTNIGPRRRGDGLHVEGQGWPRGSGVIFNMIALMTKFRRSRSDSFKVLPQSAGLTDPPPRA